MSRASSRVESYWEATIKRESGNHKFRAGDRVRYTGDNQYLLLDSRYSRLTVLRYFESRQREAERVEVIDRFGGVFWLYENTIDLINPRYSPKEYRLEVCIYA